MSSVKESVWKHSAGLLSAISIAGCDGGQKDESSAPSNVLTFNWSTAKRKSNH